MTTPPDEQIQQQVAGYWDERASDYQGFQEQRLDDPVYDAAWRRIWTQALPERPGRVLDIGTGSGHAAITVAELGHRVTGLDLAPAMLEFARRAAARRGLDIDFVPGDAIRPALPVAAFDAIVSRYVVWTLPDVDTALANWHRLLRPGGHLGIIDAPWHADGRYPEQAARSHAYDDRVRARLPLAEAQTIDAWVERIAAAGFIDVQATPLDEIYELDGVHGVAPDETRVLQYLVTARTPRPAAAEREAS
ncbi:MAG: class I SAM-dependent methyltransferase [Pseudoclavibacter sp.]